MPAVYWNLQQAGAKMRVFRTTVVLAVAGLKTLTPAQIALAEFLLIDPDWLAAAAEVSSWRISLHSWRPTPKR